MLGKQVGVFPLSRGLYFWALTLQYSICFLLNAELELKLTIQILLKLYISFFVISYKVPKGCSWRDEGMNQKCILNG